MHEVAAVRSDSMAKREHGGDAQYEVGLPEPQISLYILLERAISEMEGGMEE